MPSANSGWPRSIAILIALGLAVFVADFTWASAVNTPSLSEGQSPTLSMVLKSTAFLRFAGLWLPFLGIALAFWLRSSASLWLSGLVLLGLFLRLPDDLLLGYFPTAYDLVIIPGTAALFAISVITITSDKNIH